MISKTEFTIESVLLSSERISEDIELKQVVTDIDIYESLDKPYLTADIVFLDVENFLEKTDIIGGEKISISIRSNRKNTRPIKKNFYVNNVRNQERVNTNAQILVFHLIEDSAYISNLQNINKYYEGKCGEILEKIIKEYLGKELTYHKNEKQIYNFIVPNLDPMQTLMWIIKNISTHDGYPFFLYSTFISSKLVLRDLSTLLTSDVLNPGRDEVYQWNAMAVSSMEPHVARRSIRSFKKGRSEDLFKLIQKGLIGSKYSFINTSLDSAGCEMSFDYDVVEDLLKPSIKFNLIPKNQNNPAFSPKFEYSGESFNKIQSRHISKIGGSTPYRDSYLLPKKKNTLPEYSLTMGEAYDAATYKLPVSTQAVNNLLAKNPLTINVNGIDFIDGNSHSTIGNQLRCHFPKSNPETQKRNPEEDKKLSGDYLIYKARHIIKKEKYDMSLGMVKIGRY